MSLNPYFNNDSYAPEQNLVEDLIVESIQIYGKNAYYLKRDDVDVDTLLGEDELSTFTTAYPIEIYLKSLDSFAGQSEFISKFGLHIEDQASFLVAVRRFNEVTSGVLSRPREGDIIYIQMAPTNRYLFEIRFVENKEQLFQLGKLYTYELRCEMMNYSHERVQTNVPDINAKAEQAAYTILIPLSTGNGEYTVGETVYQGHSFPTAVASGTVSEYDDESNLLYVQNISGTFGNTLPVVGVSSGASWLPVDTPDTATNDPLSDNELLNNEQERVVLNRGRNPLINP